MDCRLVRKQYMNIEFLEFENRTMALREYPCSQEINVEELRVKGYNMCNLFSHGSERICMYTEQKNQTKTTNVANVTNW